MSSMIFLLLLCSIAPCFSRPCEATSAFQHCDISDEVAAAHEDLETQAATIHLLQKKTTKGKGVHPRLTNRRKRDGTQWMPLAWVHVPKCGTTLINTLIRLPGACTNMTQTNDTYSMGGMPVDGTTNFEMTFPDWPTLCPGLYKPPLISVDHENHLLGQHYAISSLFNDAFDGHGVILLRQPEQRAISLYSYHATLRETFHLSDLRELMDVRTYATYTAGCAVRMLTREEVTEDMNLSKDASYSQTLEVFGAKDNYFMYIPSHCVRVNDNPSAAEVKEAQRRLRAFAFVGITEEWELSICLMHAMFGGECHASEFAGTRVQRNSTSDLYDTSELEGFVDQYDGALYEVALSIFNDTLAQYGVSYETCSSCFQEAGLDFAYQS